jgi:hypothetical protein
MGFTPFTCALGDSPAVSIPAAATTNISPGDDSVDTNRIIITGSGTINSFGIACGGNLGFTGERCTVTKRVQFAPTGTITLHHNSPTLNLLGAADRVITVTSFGEYQSDVNGNWQEISFSEITKSPTMGGGLIDVIYYLASQTITIPQGAVRAWVRMWGGSGASPNSTSGSSGYYYMTSGVGAPGYLEKWLTGLTPGNTLVFTRGNGGTVASTNGSASTLASGTQTIGTLTAGGSNGSSVVGFADPSGALTATAAGSAGGIATGGDLNRPGQTGGPAISMNGGLAVGIGGYNSIGRGVDGTANAPGIAGIPGGAIIHWYGDKG